MELYVKVYEIFLDGHNVTLRGLVMEDTIDILYDENKIKFVKPEYLTLNKDLLIGKDIEIKFTKIYKGKMYDEMFHGVIKGFDDEYIIIDHVNTNLKQIATVNKRYNILGEEIN